MSYPIKSPKKLIEVALPLDAINSCSAAEKLIKVGKPTNLHLWWARRPLAAARAIIFAQLVNDPASMWEALNPGEGASRQQRGGFTRRRDYLFRLISELVMWENTANEEVLAKAREEIRKSWREVCELNKDHPEATTLFNPEKMPGMHDPFAGGGVLPLEAQRLGLDAFASDLNPVAVLINKALIEIPPKFANRPPVHPDTVSTRSINSWRGIAGLAEDVRRYGNWMQAEATKRMGALYPSLRVTSEMASARDDLTPYVGRDLTVIAWLWARTVRSPNPAFSHVMVPLVSNFIVSSKEGKEAWIEPVVQGDSYRFCVHRSPPPTHAADGTKAGKRGADFRCILSGAAIGGDYIKDEAQAGRASARLMAIVADGDRGRVYLSPTPEHEETALAAKAEWRPDVEFFQQALGFRIGNYGMTKWSDLFTSRQLVAHTTFCSLVDEARERVRVDSLRAGADDDGMDLEHGGSGARAYSDAIGLYLAFALSRMADWGNSLARWESKAQVPQQLFGRQAIPMVWDYCEPNVLSTSTGSYAASLANIDASFKRSSAGAVNPGTAIQADAQTDVISQGKWVTTDPPYYDNIGYADLSDFFYVWLRRALRSAFPSLFLGLTVPKAEELVATPIRHGTKDQAESFFLRGMTTVFRRLARQAHPSAPITIYYAFKQSETDAGVTSSSGWETFLDALMNADLMLTGTWPLRTENTSRMRGQDVNALASSIVLVCRKRPDNAPTIGRREFIRELDATLPLALDEMTRGSADDATASPVAPVDLSQAIIGPGMAVFSKYSAVLEADGTPMSVKTALQLINRFLAEDDFDADTQFCLRWFEQHHWGEGQYGEADVLARAKATSVGGLDAAGVVVSGGGRVRLRKWAEYPVNWDPKTDKRLPVWEALHQLIRVFNQDGESGAGLLLGAVRSKGEAIRQLAYRLYTLCERGGMAEDARAYNELVTTWPALESVAETVVEAPAQQDLPFGGGR